MKCHRCQGCMAVDHMLDLMESGGEWWTTTWRCLNCGYVVDPVLEQNRRKQQAALVTASVAVTVPEDHLSDEEHPVLDIAA